MVSLRPLSIRTTVLLVLFLLLGVTDARHAKAAPGIDVVVLVDQSGSMWGHPRYHPAKNDAGAYRIQAVKEIVERLAADVEGTKREHTISIFSFDRTVMPYRQDLLLVFDPSRPGEALLQAQAAMRGFDEIKNMDQPWTNTPAAFADAMREFSRLRAAGSGAEPREAHLLLITDGRPYLEGRSLSSLREDIRRSARQMRGDGIQLWVLGINDADNYWTIAKENAESDGEFWESITGNRQHASKADSPSFPAVQRIVSQFVDAWLGTPSDRVIPGQPFTVPPFQRRVTFTANFNDPSAPFQVIDPLQRPVPMPPRDPLSRFVRVSVPNPEPGEYRFLLDGSKSYEIRAELLPAQAELVSPLGRQPLDANTRIILRAMGDNGQPLSLDPKQVTSAEITVTTPDRRQKAIPAQAEASAQFSASWRTDQPGVHTLAVTVEAVHAGSRYTMFAQTPVHPSIEVSLQRPLYLALVDPDPSSRIFDLPPINDLDVSVALVDGGGGTVDAQASGIATPDQWLSVVPVDGHGTALAAPIPLNFDSGGNRWHGNVPVNADWTRGDGWYAPAEVYLHFEPAQQHLGVEHAVNGLLLPAGAIDRRVAGDAFSVGPIEVSWPDWLRWSALALLLIAFVGGLILAVWQLVRLIFIGTIDPPHKGRLELRIFDRDHDPHGVNAQRFFVQGLLRLKKDRQIKAEIAGKTVVLEKFRYSRSWQSRSRPRARIVYRWPGQAKDSRTDISEGQARPLAGADQASYYVALSYRK